MDRRPRSWFRTSLALALAVTVVGFAACSIPVADPLGVPDCVKATGICVPEGDCAPSGGTVPGTSDCHFDTGPAECCVGTKPKAKPVSCEDEGGICLPGSDCAPGHGYFGATDPGCSGRGGRLALARREREALALAGADGDPGVPLAARFVGVACMAGQIGPRSSKTWPSSLRSGSDGDHGPRHRPAPAPLAARRESPRPAA